MKPRQPSKSLTAIAASPSVTLLGILYELCDCSVPARRAGTGIEMNSSTHRRKMVMPALLLGLHLCVSYVKESPSWPVARGVAHPYQQSFFIRYSFCSLNPSVLSVSVAAILFYPIQFLQPHSVLMNLDAFLQTLPMARLYARALALK